MPMDSGVQVRVLRPRRPPVECASVVAMSNLIDHYGGGNLRDSEWSLLQHDDDNLPAGQYTYVCGLEPHLVSALQKVQERKVPLKLDAPTRRGLLRAAMDAMLADAREIVDFIPLFDLADEAWVNGLIAVIGADYSTDALPALIDYASSTASAVRVPASVAGVLVEAWRRPFEDPLGGVDYLLGELEKNVDQWKRHTAYHAAWTVLLQSSGWGKSRTVCELHTKGVHVVYVSFLSTGSSGYPQGSAVSRLVSADGSDPCFVAAWIFSILPELVGTSPTQWMELQMGDTSAKELEERVRKRYAELREQVCLVPQMIPREGEEWDSSHLRAWVQEKTDDLPLGKMKVLIHLDEAATFFRHVPGSFLATRRFFSCIKRGSWIFGLVSDTAGKLGLVFPEKMFDPSARSKGLETMFFKPVWVVGTLWGDGKQLLQSMNLHQAEDLTIPSLQVTREVFKWGRPLWRSTVEGAGAGSGAGFLDEVVAFAIQKLLGGITLSALQQKNRMTTGMGMAILGVAAGLEVVAWSDLAKDMVANHMRTVSYIAGERDLVFSADAVEPILGEAAARILVDNLRLVLKVAEGVFKQGYVVEGPRGEIVGRLVMVLAMHAQCHKTSLGTESLSCNLYSHPVKLQDFLTTLCGKDVETEGLVCFNRFIMLNRRKITREHLLICFICCMAIIPPRGQKAFDAMVPVLLPGPGGKYEVRADRMVGLPVQIRNRICTSVDTKPLATSAREFYFGDAKDDIADEEDDIASSDSNPKKMSVVEEKDEDDEDGDEDDCDDPDFIPESDSESDGENEQQLRKRSRIIQQAKLDLPLGIYMHLGGRKKSTDPELDDGNAKVLILHGLNYSFLKVEDLKSLQQLRSAFFKLDDHLEGKQGIIVRHNLSNYLMPMDLESKPGTKEDLQRHCSGLDIAYGKDEKKKDLAAKLAGEGLADDKFLDFLPG